jgi:hypothetical protein
MWIRLALLPTLLSACAPSPTEFVEPRRAAAAERLAKVFEARDRMKEAPAVFEDTMLDPGPMSLCDLMVPPFRDQPCDTWAIDLAQLEGPDRYRADGVVSFGQAEWLVLTKSLLETGRYPPNDKYPEGAEVDRLTRPIEHGFRWLENLRYLIIVEPTDALIPSITPDQKAYVAGRYEGAARLYSIHPTVRDLGAVRFEFAMTGDIRVRMKGGKINKVELLDAFTRAVRAALTDKLKTRLRQLEAAPG